MPPARLVNAILTSFGPHSDTSSHHPYSPTTSPYRSWTPLRRLLTSVSIAGILIAALLGLGTVFDQVRDVGIRNDFGFGLGLGSRGPRGWGHGRLPETVIVTTDTRVPSMDLDPEVKLNYWTIAALHNHLYALSLQSRFIWFAMESPVVDGDPPMPNGRPAWQAMEAQHPAHCQHLTMGWRSAHFCKLPIIWNFYRTNREVQNVVFIDSDAVFRSPNISMHRHLDELSTRRPFGVLTNRPYDAGPCSGYWFLGRGRETADPVTGKVRSAGEDWLLEWWNEDWKLTEYKHGHEQSLLRRMMGGDYPGGRVGPKRDPLQGRVVLLDEWQFQEKSSDQMIIHIDHTKKNRAEELARRWAWKDEYPLDDRVKLSKLLSEVDIRMVRPDDYTVQMPLPGEQPFVN